MSTKTERKPYQFIRNDIFKKMGRMTLAFLVAIVLFSATWEVLSTSESGSIQKQDPEGTTSVTAITATVTDTYLQVIPTNQITQSTRLPDEWKLSFSAAATVFFGLMAIGFWFGPLTIKVSGCVDYIVGIVCLCVAVLCAVIAYMIWR